MGNYSIKMASQVKKVATDAQQRLNEEKSRLVRRQIQTNMDYLNKEIEKVAKTGRLFIRLRRNDLPDYGDSKELTDQQIDDIMEYYRTVGNYKVMYEIAGTRGGWDEIVISWENVSVNTDNLTVDEELNLELKPWMVMLILAVVVALMIFILG